MGRAYQISVKTCSFLVLLSFFLWADWALAGKFKGLQPGVSKKSDADTTLGKPIKEVIKGERYDYDPPKDDTQRISILFRKATQIIDAIDIHPRGSFKKGQFREWLNLTAPQKGVKTKAGHFVEYYISEGVVLYYAGPDDSYPVQFFSHFDPSNLSREGTTEKKREATHKSEDEYSEMVTKAEKAEDWVTLKKIVDEGLHLYPNNGRLWNGRAVYYFYNKTEPNEVRYRELLNSAKRAYDLDRNEKHAIDLGWIYLEIYKDYYSAIRLFEEWEEKSASKHPTFYYWMARCYEEMGARTKAKPYYERFLSISPQHDKAPDARQRLQGLN
jgi:tetratricopeptide (TPR) repeat protein